jgi:hypothetical protein
MMSRFKQLLQFILAGLRRMFRREDLPAVVKEKKRPYSISGWERGEDGAFRQGDEQIYRKGRNWIRVDDGGEWATWPSLHAAIKQEQSVQGAPVPQGTFPLIAPAGGDEPVLGESLIDPQGDLL